MKTAVIIPVYKPDDRLKEWIGLWRSLAPLGVIVVDDGSPAEYAALLDELRSCCWWCGHVDRQGRGEAVRTGMREAARLWPECTGCVVADPEGPYSAQELLGICVVLEAHPGRAVVASGGPCRPVATDPVWGRRMAAAVARLSGDPFPGLPDTWLGLPMRMVDKRNPRRLPKVICRM